MFACTNFGASLFSLLLPVFFASPSFFFFFFFFYFSFLILVLVSMILKTYPSLCARWPFQVFLAHCTSLSHVIGWWCDAVLRQIVDALECVYQSSKEMGKLFCTHTRPEPNLLACLPNFLSSISPKMCPNCSQMYVCKFLILCLIKLNLIPICTTQQTQQRNSQMFITLPIIVVQYNRSFQVVLKEAVLLSIKCSI